MKPAILPFLLLLAACASAPADSPPPAPAPTPAAEPAPAPGGPLSVADCARLALTGRRAVAIAERRVLMAEDEESRVSSTFHPRLDLSGAVRRTSEPTGANFGGQTVETADVGAGSFALSGVVPVYTFGLAEHTRAAARLGVEAAGFAGERTRQDVVLAARLAFFRVLEAERIREVVADSIRVVDREIEVGRSLESQGLRVRADVLAIEVRRAEREAERISAEANVRLAVSTLNRAIGRDVTADTKLADVLDDRGPLPSFEEAAAIAVARRPDLAALDRRVEIAREGVEATRAEGNPVLTVFGRYDRSTDSHLAPKDWFTAGLGVTWSLFDGGVRAARVARGEREIEEAIDLRGEAGEDAMLELRAAWLAAGEASARIPVARKAEELAELNLKLSRDRFAQGLVLSSDLLEDENRLAFARSRHYQALYGYQAARARLAHAMGLAWEEE